MSNKFKIIVCVLFSILVIPAIQLYDRISWYQIEDNIHGTYAPVIKAASDFEKNNNSIPVSLESLIPEYIQRTPESEYGVAEYSVIDNKNWQLAIESKDRGEKRIYLFRTNHHLSADEKERLIKEFHYWKVLKSS